MGRYKKVSEKTSIACRFYYEQGGVTIRQLAERFNLPRSTVYRHATQPADFPTRVDKRKQNKGRPRKIDIRCERGVTRAVNALRVSNGLSFSTNEIRGEARIQQDIHHTTRTIN